RGGEEAIALRHAAVPFDIVPGVTSAIAAPAAAGIPVTHRGLSSAFLVVSGHELDAFTSAVAALKSNCVTLVGLMGLGRAAAIAAALIDRGWSRGTPAAVVVDGWTADQQQWTGALDALAAGAGAFDDKGAGTIVIGQVVGLAAVIGSVEPREREQEHV